MAFRHGFPLARRRRAYSEMRNRRRFVPRFVRIGLGKHDRTGRGVWHREAQELGGLETDRLRVFSVRAVIHDGWLAAGRLVAWVVGSGRPTRLRTAAASSRRPRALSTF